MSPYVAAVLGNKKESEKPQWDFSSPYPPSDSKAREAEEYFNKLYDENMKLKDLAAHYAFLEANDAGDSHEPASKLLSDLGYTEHNQYKMNEAPDSYYSENKRLKEQIKRAISTLVNIKMSLMLCTSRHLDNLALANISRIDQTLKKVSV